MPVAKAIPGFLAVMNGPKAKALQISLSFLNHGSYDASMVKDDSRKQGNALAGRETVTKQSRFAVDLDDAGGFVARFTPTKQPAKHVVTDSSHTKKSTDK